MKVKEAMHRGAEWVSPDTPLTDVARLMQKHDIGALPVGDNDRLVGMVTDRDIVCRCVAAGKDAAGMTARDVMTRGIVYCKEAVDLDEAIEIMRNKQIRRLPVINEAKRMVGILSLGDLSHALPEGDSGEVLKAVSAHH
jgi:CBS domain-containing protein